MDRALQSTDLHSVPLAPSQRDGRVNDSLVVLAGGTDCCEGTGCCAGVSNDVARLGKGLFWAVLLATAGMVSRQENGSGDNSQNHAVQRVLQTAIQPAVMPGQPVFEQTFFDSIAEAPSVHASTIAVLPRGELVAAWFGGTREGAKDVSIYLSEKADAAAPWQAPRVVVDAASASRQMGRLVKKLGNPVLHCDHQGRLWLYYVTVSVGGWSGSSISVMHSDDRGITWSPSRRLLSSPFLNISNLVRSVPIEVSDGTILLPVYHEFIYKYGELLHLADDGRLIGKYRMNSGQNALQPTLVIQPSLGGRTPDRLLAYYRRGSGLVPKVLANESFDVGKTWTAIRTIDLPNPNASVAVVRRHDGGLLMALNASETERRELSLAVSIDGSEWEILKTLPATENGGESSYPTLISDSDGKYHLTYTWGRDKISHVRFNDAWLEEKP